MELNDDNRMCFLSLFTERERSGAAKRFLDPIRAGVTGSASAVVAAAMREVRGRLEQAQYWAVRGGSDDAVEIHRRVLTALAEHTEEALRCAGYYLAYEALPPEEKAQVKADHTAVMVKAAYDGQPATDPQKKYLREGFHYRGDVDALTKRQASELIEKFKGERSQPRG